MNISRRDFLRMAAYSAAAVGATQFDMFKLKEALAAGRPPVIWFEGLGDSGCVVSVANYFDGTSAGIESVLLNNIDLEFNSVLMGASGNMAIGAAKAVYDNYLTTPYILVLSGALSELNGYAVVGDDTTPGGLGVMNVIDAFNRVGSACHVGYLCGCLRLLWRSKRHRGEPNFEYSRSITPKPQWISIFCYYPEYKLEPPD